MNVTVYYYFLCVFVREMLQDTIKNFITSLEVLFAEIVTRRSIEEKSSYEWVKLRNGDVN